MEWIKLLVEANPLSAALVCLFLALFVMLAMIKKKGKKDGEDDYPNLSAALARFEKHMTWAEDEIKSIKTKVDPLVIAVATLNVIVAALKEKVEEHHDQVDKKLDRVLDKLG